MDSKGYYRIIEGVTNLIGIIMVEAGKVPYDSAKKISDNIYKAITGSTLNKK